MSLKSLRRDWPLLLAGAFALIWIVHRALVQSVTLDEADTYSGYVEPDWSSHWYPTTGNHVLNSALIRLFVWLFGLSHLTLRLPALIGGAIYIYAAYRICVLLTEDLGLKLPLFLCFVYNPFVMDYLVAARGYGLAMGFLTLALFLIARMVLHDQYSKAEARAASICVALSFCANFSFAYVNAFLIAVLVVWLWRRGTIRLAPAAVIPGVVVAFLICGSTIAGYPREQLTYGARSLREMWDQIQNASFPAINDYLVNPLLANWLRYARVTLIWIGLLTTAALAAIVLIRRTASPKLRAAGYAATVLALTLLAHWLQFKLAKIPLPLDRTSLFILPLALTIGGAVFSMAPVTRLEQAVRAMGLAALIVASTYFVGSLRDGYFLQWKYDAEVWPAFPAVMDATRRTGVKKVHCSWHYGPSLKFYRSFYGVKDIEIVSDEKPQPGAGLYALYGPHFRDFIQKERLQVVFDGPLSGIVIAVRPCKNTKND